MNVFRFLASKVFWINLLFIIVFVVLLVWGALFYLDNYTQHGKSVTVPDLHGLTLDQTSEMLESRELFYEITDSIYSDDFPRGSVVMQNPNPNSEVKKTRVIFLTVNSQLPEMVKMPDLVGKSRRIALALLEISGIELDKLEYKPDEACTDCVLEQLFEGEPIEPEEKIRKGEKVTLVLGKEGYANISVPGLQGITYSEAINILNSSSLNTGLILSCNGCITAEDTLNAFVINQIPTSDSRVSIGSYIDVYLSTEASDIDKQILDSDTL